MVGKPNQSVKPVPLFPVPVCTCELTGCWLTVSYAVEKTCMSANWGLRCFKKVISVTKVTPGPGGSKGRREREESLRLSVRFELWQFLRCFVNTLSNTAHLHQTDTHTYTTDY